MSETRTKPPRTFRRGLDVPARAVVRTPQSYCDCGAKKNDRAKRCLDCNDRAREDQKRGGIARLRERTKARRKGSSDEADS